MKENNGNTDYCAKEDIYKHYLAGLIDDGIIALEETLTQQYSQDEDEDDITNVEELCEYLYRQSSEACGEYDFVVENMRNYLFKLEVEKQTERNG